MEAMQAAFLANKPEEAAKSADQARAYAHEALNLFDAAGAPQSNDADVLQVYARACAATDNWDLAARAYERALAAAPDQAALRIELGEAWLNAGPEFHDKAFMAAQATAGDESLGEAERAHALRLLGDVYWEASLYEAAGKAYQAADEKSRGSAETAFRLAAVEARLGEMAGASARLDALGNAAQPLDAEIRMRLRTALYGFEQMRLTFPETPANHEGYGRLLYRAGRVAESILPLRRALTLDPSNTHVLNFLGDVQWQIGNGQIAVTMFEQSLEADPNQPRIREKVQAMKEALSKTPAAGS